MDKAYGFGILCFFILCTVFLSWANSHEKNPVILGMIGVMGLCEIGLAILLIVI